MIRLWTPPLGPPTHGHPTHPAPRHGPRAIHSSCNRTPVVSESCYRIAIRTVRGKRCALPVAPVRQSDDNRRPRSYFSFSIVFIIVVHYLLLYSLIPHRISSAVLCYSFSLNARLFFRTLIHACARSLARSRLDQSRHQWTFACHRVDFRARGKYVNRFSVRTNSIIVRSTAAVICRRWITECFADFDRKRNYVVCSR